MNNADFEILQQKLNDSPQEKRTKLLHFVSGICRQRSSSIAGQYMQIFANITETLIDGADLDALCEAASIFAHLQSAPHSLIYKLAQQRIEAAAVVIENSTVLTDDDLIEIILKNGTEHQKHIVKRKILSSRVTDSLTDVANVADHEILDLLLQNTGASFSEKGYIKLAGVSVQNDSIASRLFSRPDMPQNIAIQLLENLDLVGSGKLMEKDEKLRIKFGQEALKAHAIRSQRELFLPLAKIYIDQIGRGEKKLDACLIDLCTQGADQVLCQVIAAFTKTPEEVITAALFSVNGTRILHYCKTLELARETFLAIVTLRSQRGNLPNSQIFYLMKQFDTMPA